ncbi:universal stress protein [Mycolicibacterium agri]|uniref:Universal stress protein n=1 Tax=Mycolicibacterium agri TaxID=36811 RepID=A0A2A7MQG9_MYCAG|nr:universal stress protein [Mycolicibacterium agri]PEG33790.1 universal stress protein [Mycolicibacterium agri]GFG50345.1 universal stress protein [Mycolicibacterium agri]
MSMSQGAVIVGVDGSDDSLNAARWAAAVAAKFETSLHILHAMPSFGHNLTDTVLVIRAAAMSYQRDYAQIILRSAVDTVRAEHPDLELTTESTETPADEALIELSQTARMIVVGNSEVTAAGALLLGSTTLAVATHAACPVVAWRNRRGAPTSDPVVVGTDGSAPSEAALAAAFEFADAFGCKVAAVRSRSAFGPLAAVANTLPVDWTGLEAAEWTQLTDAVDRHNQRHPDVSAACFIETTKPSVALLDRGKADRAQLIVVGNRGRNPLTSAVLGSTTLNLLQHSPIPVMVCRENR